MRDFKIYGTIMNNSEVMKNDGQNNMTNCPDSSAIPRKSKDIIITTKNRSLVHSMILVEVNFVISECIFVLQLQ